MPVAQRDPYEVLGVPRDAGQDDIQSAYRRLARQYHPDVNKEPGAEDRFKEVSEAYDLLRDPEHRAEYDSGGRRRQAGYPFAGDVAGSHDLEDRLVGDLVAHVDGHRVVALGIEALTALADSPNPLALEDRLHLLHDGLKPDR